MVNKLGRQQMKAKERKLGKIKNILLWIAAVILVLPVLLILIACIIIASNDPSAKAPLYSGEIIDDPKQRPINSIFNHKSTAMDVVKGLDLTGKIIVMTGGHSGTGREAARALASRGASIIALARDVERAKKNLKGIPNTEVMYVDLLEPDSIDAFADQFLQSGRPIHVLINSAGIMNTPLQYDARGYERQFATNVLGHFHLTLRLIPMLEKAQGGRVVNLSSRGHREGDVIFDDINFEHTEYTGMRAYAQSKTALILFSIKLDDLLKDRNIRSFAVHPGPVPETDLWAAGQVGYAPQGRVNFMRLSASIVRGLNITELLNFFRNPANEGDIYKNVYQGGATTAWAAVSSDLNGKGGLYLEDCNIAPVVPNNQNAPFGVRPWALDKTAADRLWTICEDMTGVKFERRN
jgi:NAD(P)-dependent dehydrogenase (short-subunit alcohol dehydrogenase family)